jgi:hypothetical protein
LCFHRLKLAEDGPAVNGARTPMGSASVLIANHEHAASGRAAWPCA